MGYSQKSSLYFKDLFSNIKENIKARKRIKEDISGAGTGEGTVRVFSPKGERKELKTRKYVKQAMKTFKSGGGEPTQVTDLEGKYMPSVGYERRMQLQKPTKKETKTKPETKIGNLLGRITPKKVITKDLESKSNPFVDAAHGDDVRVQPVEGRGFYSMPKGEYIKQASKVYRKTGLKPTEKTRTIQWPGEEEWKNYSYFELPQSKKVNIKIGERDGGLEGYYTSRRKIEMSAAKNKPKKVKEKKHKSKFKYRTGGVKQKAKYLRKGKFIN